MGAECRAHGMPLEDPLSASCIAGVEHLRGSQLYCPNQQSDNRWRRLGSGGLRTEITKAEKGMGVSGLRAGVWAVASAKLGRTGANSPKDAELSDGQNPLVWDWGKLFGAAREEAMRRSDLVQNADKGSTPRTTQIVFGERQHLLRVLDSLEGTDLPRVRQEQERQVLEQLIHARTQELNHINPDWDEKVGVVLSADVKSELLEKLARTAPKTDFYLLRLISEHPKASSKTLGKLARHPYAAIRENVARHPNADAATLAWLSRDRSQPLWYLVAFNPNTPAGLRSKLQERLRKLGNSNPQK